MLRLSQEINIAEVLYPDEVGIASVAPEMFCHFSLFTSSLFQDILGKLMQKENYKSLTRPLLIMHMKCSKSSLIVMPRKVSHKEATDGSFYEGSDKYKIAGSLTTL